MDLCVKQNIADELQIDPDSLTSDTPLADLPYWDSVTILSVMVILGDATGQEISPMEMANLKTFGDIEALYAAKTG